jgi:hypothetical protein
MQKLTATRRHYLYLTITQARAIAIKLAPVTAYGGNCDGDKTR